MLRAVERADDARDIAKDMLRRLPAYTAGEEEDTARRDIGPRFVVENHQHIHQHSQPETEEPEIAIGPAKVSGPKWLIAALALLVAAGTAIVAHFADK